jgi:hypothetical protein
MSSLHAGDAFELGRVLQLVSVSLPDDVSPTFAPYSKVIGHRLKKR